MEKWSSILLASTLKTYNFQHKQLPARLGEGKTLTSCLSALQADTRKEKMKGVIFSNTNLFRPEDCLNINLLGKIAVEILDGLCQDRLRD